MLGGRLVKHKKQVMLTGKRSRCLLQGELYRCNLDPATACAVELLKQPQKPKLRESPHDPEICQIQSFEGSDDISNSAIAPTRRPCL